MKPGDGSLFIDHATIWTGGSAGELLADHGLLIEGGVITGLVSDHRPPVRPDRTLDARGKILLPGFINAHTHGYSAFARGIPGIRPSAGFPDILHNLWWKLDSVLTLEDCAYSALLLYLDSIRHGTTTVIDHHASPRSVEGSLTALEDAASMTGIRTCLCYEVSDRDGRDVAAAGIAENVSFLKHCREQNGGLIGGLFGLHASFTLGEATLRDAAEAGRSIGSGFHIHCAEGSADQEITGREFGMKVVERLNHYGILGPRTIAAHCVHLSASEIDLLAGTDSIAVHNPQSNLNNGVGIADIPLLAERGVLVGLGTDAMTARMPEEARAGVWAQHLRAGGPSRGFGEISSALLDNNPKIAERLFGLPIGTIAPGAAGDVILLDYLPTTPLTRANFCGHLLYGMAHAEVDTTVVAGQIRMEGKRFPDTIDEERICRRSRELAAAVWKRLSSSQT